MKALMSSGHPSHPSDAVIWGGSGMGHSEQQALGHGGCEKASEDGSGTEKQIPGGARLPHGVLRAVRSGGVVRGNSWQSHVSVP